MTEEDLRDIEERASKAKAGPWRFGYEWGNAGDFEDDWHRIAGPGGQVCGNYGYEEGGVIREEDAAFIAHSREDIPALVAEVRRLREAMVHVLDYLLTLRANISGRERDWRMGFDPLEVPPMEDR